MSPRIIPALLASLGFLATFTIRSWHADLWHLGRGTDIGLVSTSPSPAAADSKSIAAAPPPSRQQLPSPALQQSARRREMPLPTPRRLVTFSDARAFMRERAREADHSARAH